MTIELNEHNVPGLVAGIVFLIAVYTFSGIWIFTHEGRVSQEEGDSSNEGLWNICAGIFWIFTLIFALAFVAGVLGAVILPFI